MIRKAEAVLCRAARPCCAFGSRGRTRRHQEPSPKRAVGRHAVYVGSVISKQRDERGQRRLERAEPRLSAECAKSRHEIIVDRPDTAAAGLFFLP